jgi:hypothetical protein
MLLSNKRKSLAKSRYHQLEEVALLQTDITQKRYQASSKEPLTN